MNRLYFVKGPLAQGVVMAAISLAAGAVAAQTQMADLPAQDSLEESASWNWLNLQDWSQQAHPSVQLSRLKEHVASHNLSLLEADNGVKFIAATGTTRAKEAVTETVDRRYSRTYGQVGVRMSLLAAAEERQRNVLQAKFAQQAEAAQTRLLQMQSVTETGRMYVRYTRSQQREKLADQFLMSSKDTGTVTGRRVAQGFMLKSEALELQGLRIAAQARAKREQEVQRAALAQMAYLTGRRLGRQMVAPLEVSRSCTVAESSQSGDHPLLEATRLALQGVQERSALTRYGAIEGGVQLNQSLSKDWGGSAGHATGVAVDIAIPWNWREQKTAMAAKLQAERDLAAQQHFQERQKLQMNREDALAQWHMRADATAPVLEQYRAAQEALRVAMLRKDALDGDGIAQLIRVRYMLYERALQYVDSLESRDMAAVEMSYFIEGCVLQTGRSDEAVEVGLKTSAVDVPKVAGVVSSEKQVAMGGVALPQGTGWYAWVGREWLNDPQRITELPKGTQRLLLSFDEKEIVALTQAGKTSLQLTELARLAGQRNISLELLLGEPTWVLPSARAHLYRLISLVQPLPFRMIHLDLERSQLPQNQQGNWEKDVVALLAEATRKSELPISLTTHYRELLLPGFVADLGKAGVKEVIPMIYSASPVTTLAIMRRIPRLPQGMQIAVAQSIEKELTKDESFFLRGRTEAADEWKKLANSLGAEIPGFKGIVVQSWNEYLEARP